MRSMIQAVRCALLLAFAVAAARAQEQGLAVTFQAGQNSDSTIVSNAWLYVPQGQAPSPFVPAGPFKAEWRGFVSVDLRSDYTFAAELNGAVKVEVNGALALEGATNGGLRAPKAIRLNKGTNALVATFSSPASGDARLRLTWIPKEGPPGPMPNNALTPARTPEVERGQQLRLGRQLAIDHRCFHCHADAAPKDSMAELQMDAPSFEGIGSRRNFDWMAAWIADPATNRARAQMPRVFHGPEAQVKAKAAAAFLASLKGGDAKPAQGTTEQAEAGQQLFQTLHCAGCHNAPDAADSGEGKISLAQVSAKFRGGALADFLKQPNAHYFWIRMPDFKLSDEEALNLAAYLHAKAPAPPAETSPAPADIETGRKLVQTTGCLNCHTAKLENQFKVPAAVRLDSGKGCLDPAHPGSAPHFEFSESERRALAAFISTDRKSLERPAPAEFASRHAQLLNCASCHSEIELIPHVDILGGKLKPEWAEKFIAGKIDYKPRPWIEARMPAFPAYAEGLAKGMALQHGYPPATPAEGPIDREAAEVGRTLISAVGGFACIGCHAVGDFGATQVFESAGINLIYSDERLLRDFFHRWVRNPLAIDPSSKMPVYFDDEGNSPLTDYYGGDAHKQIEAMRQYIRLRDKMPPPKTE